MLDFVTAGARSFEGLGRGTFQTAKSEIASTFPAQLADNAAAKSCHSRVALALQSALGAAAKPSVRLTLAPKQDSFEIVELGGSSSKVDLTFLEIGDRIFPVKCDAQLWGKKSLTLYEPRPAGEFDETKVCAKGLEGFYGGPAKAEKAAQIALFRDKGPTTHVQMDAGAVLKDQPYGWAIWESVTSALRRAQSPESGASSPSSFTPAGPSARAAFKQLIAGKGTAEAGGPPLGHDLLAAYSWRGRPVAITSHRGGDRPISVFVQDKVGPGGKLAWIELPWPETPAALPHGSSGAVLAGDLLHVIGGRGEDGEMIKTHWTLDLSKASKSGWSSAPWATATPLETGLAWPVLAATAKETLVLGGVAQFYVEEGKKKPQHRRTMSAEPSGGGWSWGKRGAAPADVTGSSVIVGRDAVFVGPGSSFDGKMFAYDTAAGGEWVVLPELPIDAGLGQLHLDGEHLVYSGGFYADGKVCKSVYELDLSSPSAEWKKVGESDYAAGRARIVESHGHMVSLMVSPKGRITFHAGLGG